MLRKTVRLILALLLLPVSVSAGAAVFSFSGNFGRDDDVQLFRFTLEGPSLNIVTLLTLSYGGGVDSAGAVVPPGGFDPVVALFDAAGALIAEDDDGSTVADAVTGESLDAFLQIGIPAGVYFAALTQSPNFAFGPTLADGFELAGTGDFTGGFMDVFGNQRDSRWALDILDVASASVFPTAVPEPGTVWLLCFALLAAALRITPRRSCAWLRCASTARAPASRAR